MYALTYLEALALFYGEIIFTIIPFHILCQYVLANNSMAYDMYLSICIIMRFSVRLFVCLCNVCVFVRIFFCLISPCFIKIPATPAHPKSAEGGFCYRGKAAEGGFFASTYIIKVPEFLKNTHIVKRCEIDEQWSYHSFIHWWLI